MSKSNFGAKGEVNPIDHMQLGATYIYFIVFIIRVKRSCKIQVISEF
jgi:hypothetical protein